MMMCPKEVVSRIPTFVCDVNDDETIVAMRAGGLAGLGHDGRGTAAPAGGQT